MQLNFGSLPINCNTPLDTSSCSRSKLSVSILRESEDVFRIIWSSTDPASVEARRCRSAADLYWIDPVTREGFWIASSIGRHKDRWPTFDSPSLSLSLSSFDLEAVNHEGSDWMKKQTYFARLYFFSDRLPQLDSDPASGVTEAQKLICPRTITCKSLSHVYSLGDTIREELTRTVFLCSLHFDICTERCSFRLHTKVCCQEAQLVVVLFRTSSEL